MSKVGSGISQMKGLLAVNQDLALPCLVTLQGMAVMILVTILTVQEVIIQDQEALPLGGPCQTEVEILYEGIMAQADLKIILKKARMTISRIIHLTVGIHKTGITIGDINVIVAVTCEHDFPDIYKRERICTKFRWVFVEFRWCYHAACDSPTVLQVPLLSVGRRLLPLFNMLKYLTFI